METKQTAVEWLIQHIKLDAMHEAKTIDEWVNVFEQAKEMEKERHNELRAESYKQAMFDASNYLIDKLKFKNYGQ